MGKVCKTCEYWCETSAHRGRCDNAAFIYAGHGLSSDEETRTDTLRYEDAGSYSASFDTGADFGCIHWEERVCPF